MPSDWAYEDLFKWIIQQKKGPMSTPSVSIPSVASLPGIDDLRAPLTRKLLALLDIAAAVSANSRVFAWQALPT